MDYSLIYRITAKIESAKKGFERIQGAFGDMTESGKIMGRRMGNLLTLQRLAWVGFAYMVGKSIFDIMRKSAMLQSFLSAWGTLLGAILDTIFATWADELMWVTEKFVALQKAIANLPEWAKKLLGGIGAVAALIVLLGALGTLLSTIVIPGLAAFGAAISAVILKLTGLGAAILGLGGILGVFVSVASGLLLGGLGVWILYKTGVLKALVDMGRRFEKMHPIIMRFAKVLLMPLGVLGTLVTYIVAGRWQEIPAAIRDVLDQAIEAFRKFPPAVQVIIISGLAGIPRISLIMFYRLGRNIVTKIISGLSGLRSALISKIRASIPNLHDIFHISPQVIAVGKHYVDLISKGIGQTKMAHPEFDATSLQKFGDEFKLKAPSSRGAGPVDNRTFNMPISVELGLTVKEEGKSVEEIATEVANVLSFKMRRVL